MTTPFDDAGLQAAIDAIFNEVVGEPSPSQMVALREYAASHGRNWKSKLLDDWFSGRCEGHLQTLRNQFGPQWLKTFQLNRGH